MTRRPGASEAKRLHKADCCRDQASASVAVVELAVFFVARLLAAAAAAAVTIHYSLFCRGKNWQTVCGIVYCFSKKDCDEMAETLRKT
jgi:superfamily II DNA helicase RecQ